MNKYKVVFEFRNSNGQWVIDDLTNNGRGFNLSDAKLIANQIRQNNIEARHIHTELMK